MPHAPHATPCSNILTIGGVPCVVTACGRGFVSAFFPGGGSGTAAAANASALVTLSVATDPSDASTIFDRNTFATAVPIVAASAAPSIASLTSAPTNGAGGAVVAELVGLGSGTDTSSGVTSAMLIPASGIVARGAKYATLSAAIAAGWEKG